MARSLSQQDIEAMVKSAKRAKAVGGSSDRRAVRDWNCRAADQLPSDKAHSIMLMHEGLARSLGRSVGAFLRVPFDVAFVTVEQAPFRDLLERLPDSPYLVPMQLLPHHGAGVIHVDHLLLFSIVDVLLGGIGKTQDQARDVTEIEDQILEAFVGIVCRELQGCWEQLKIEIKQENRQNASQVQQHIASTDKVLLLTFDVTMSEARGVITLALPISIAAQFTRDPSNDWGRRKQGGKRKLGEKLHEQLQACSFDVDLSIPGIKAKIREIVELRPGDLLRFRAPITDPVTFRVAGRGTFHALAVRRGSQRAAQLVSAIDENVSNDRRLS